MSDKNDLGTIPFLLVIIILILTVFIHPIIPIFIIMIGIMYIFVKISEQCISEIKLSKGCCNIIIVILVLSVTVLMIFSGLNSYIKEKGENHKKQEQDILIMESIQKEKYKKNLLYDVLIDNTTDSYILSDIYPTIIESVNSDNNASLDDIRDLNMSNIRDNYLYIYKFYHKNKVGFITRWTILDEFCTNVSYNARSLFDDLIFFEIYYGDNSIRGVYSNKESYDVHIRTGAPFNFNELLNDDKLSFIYMGKYEVDRISFYKRIQML